MSFQRGDTARVVSVAGTLSRHDIQGCEDPALQAAVRVQDGGDSVQARVSAGTRVREQNWARIVSVSLTWAGWSLCPVRCLNDGSIMQGVGSRLKSKD